MSLHYRKLVQPPDGVALGVIVDVSAHQIVVAGKVGIECIDGHGRLNGGELGWRIVNERGGFEK